MTSGSTAHHGASRVSGVAGKNLVNGIELLLEILVLLLVIFSLLLFGYIRYSFMRVVR